MLTMPLSGYTTKCAGGRLHAMVFYKALCMQGRAADIKAKGNAAFSAGRFQEAIQHFTSCIQLDPEYGPSHSQSLFMCSVAVICAAQQSQSQGCTILQTPQQLTTCNTCQRHAMHAFCTGALLPWRTVHWLQAVQRVACGMQE